MTQILLLSGLLFATPELELLSLRCAQEIALARHPDLRRAEQQLRALQAVSKTAEAAFDPILSLELKASKYFLPSASESGVFLPSDSIGAEAALRKRFSLGTEVEVRTGFARANEPNTLFELQQRAGLAGTETLGFISSFVELNVRQPLLRGFGETFSLFELVRARRLSEAAEAQKARDAELRRAEATRAYLLVFSRERSAAIAGRATERTKREVSLIEERVRTGMTAPTDLLRLEQRLLAQRARELNAEREVHEAKTRLEEELGLAQQAQRWTTSGAALPDHLRPDDVVSSIQTALDQRADLAARALEEEAAEVGVSRAENALRPSLDLIASAGVVGAGERTGDAFESQRPYGVGRLVFSYPLGNDAAEGELAKTEAELSQVKITAESARDGVIREVELAVTRVQMLEDRYQLAVQAKVLAEKTRVAEEKRYQNGQSSLLDMIAVDAALEEAEQTEVEAIVDRVLARAQLELALGTLRLQPPEPNCPQL